MDTSASVVLDLLASVLQRTADANDALCSPGEVQSWKTVFVSRRPPLSFAEYVDRIARFSESPIEVFITAFIYLDRFVVASPVKIVSGTLFKLFLAAVVVANKMYDDIPLNNKSFAIIGGVSTEALATLEFQFLVSLKFDICVKRKIFEEYCGLFNFALTRGETRRKNSDSSLPPVSPTRSSPTSCSTSYSPTASSEDSFDASPRAERFREAKSRSFPELTSSRNDSTSGCRTDLRNQRTSSCRNLIYALRTGVSFDSSVSS